MFDKFLSLFVAGYFRDVGVDSIERTKLLEQLLGRFRTNAMDARYVVGRIADHRLEIDHLFGADPPDLLKLLGRKELTLAEIEHGDARSDQLSTVLIASDKQHAGSVGAGPVGDGR